MEPELVDAVQRNTGCGRLREYSRVCFQIGNEWTVNYAARIIAVFNEEKSGTKNTIEYAAKVGVPIVCLNE